MFRIDNAYAKPNIPKTIRFTEEINGKLSLLAAGEHTSFNEVVLRCCQYALDEYEGGVDLSDWRKIYDQNCHMR